MRAANISLVVVGGFVAWFLGGLVGGIIGVALRNAAIGGAIVFPLILGFTFLIGKWVGRRAAPPTNAELIARGVIYAAAGVLLALIARHPVSLVLAVIAVVLFLATRQARTRTQAGRSSGATTGAS